MVSTYIPLRVHSHYSLQLGLSKPQDIAKRCLELDISSCGLTDSGTIAGTVAFYKEMVSNNIKPILGCELNIFSDNSTKLSKLTIICKNLVGWQELIKIISLTNDNKFFDKKPRIDLDSLKQFLGKTSNLICITGYYDSTLWNHIYCDSLNDSWQDQANQHLEILSNIFGKDNIFISIQLFDNFHQQKNIGYELRIFCEKYNWQRVADIDSYYCKSEDSADQKILLCSSLKTTLPEISKKIVDGVDVGVNRFFNSDQYHILSNETIFGLYDETEISNTHKINELCENFSPLNKPVLPKFDFPSEYKSESEYLRQLCREGWKKKIGNKLSKDQEAIYVNRIKYELEILEGAGLSSYFLIVRDIIEYVSSKNWLPGPGRGSAAGCLVSYLIGITNIDPIKYDLLFERFYNTGRNTKDRISMPDIDVDVPIEHREEIIEYIKSKYGNDRVSQMITFNTLKGRGALKEVLRVYDNLTFEEMNNITKNIPDEAKIADELQEIKEEEGSASIIRWALENYPDKFREWCEIDENNELTGPLAKRFEQAIRMEGVKYNQSKHAAGIAIAAKPLNEICPMIFDTKTKQNIAGLEMNDLDALGVIKFDILGIALLDKMMYINTMLNLKQGE